MKRNPGAIINILSNRWLISLLNAHPGCFKSLLEGIKEKWLQDFPGDSVQSLNHCMLWDTAKKKKKKKSYSWEIKLKVLYLLTQV